MHSFPAQNPTNVRAWNLFGLAVNLSPVMRHNRFCLRLLYKVSPFFGLFLALTLALTLALILVTESTMRLYCKLFLKEGPNTKNSSITLSVFWNEVSCLATWVLAWQG